MCTDHLRIPVVKCTFLATPFELLEIALGLVWFDDLVRLERRVVRAVVPSVPASKVLTPASNL
eukprot:3805614-Amphidinium_carterae.1